MEVDERDLALAKELAAEILGKSLDELNTVSRDLLLQVERMVESRVEQGADSETGKQPRRMKARRYSPRSIDTYGRAIQDFIGSVKKTDVRVAGRIAVVVLAELAS